MSKQIEFTQTESTEHLLEQMITPGPGCSAQEGAEAVLMCIC
jgi:hypothetical protein